MKYRIDERKVSKYLYEIAGRAGTICRTTLGKGGNPNKLCRGPKEEQEPEYIEATRLYLTLSDTELEARLAPTRENVMHPCGTPLQWDTYCRIDERAYKREYLSSNEWKRKKDAVMRRAKRRHFYDIEGRDLGLFIDETAYPMCENEGCTNEAKEVHHKTYDRIGKESLDDLQALCSECHRREYRGQHR